MEVQKIWFDNKNIFLKTKKGIEQSMPLKWFPHLEKATSKQRENYKKNKQKYKNYWQQKI